MKSIMQRGITPEVPVKTGGQEAYGFNDKHEAKHLPEGVAKSGREVKVEAKHE